MTALLVRHGRPVEKLRDFYEPKRYSGFTIGSLRRSRIGRRAVPNHEPHQWLDCPACRLRFGISLTPWQARILDLALRVSGPRLIELKRRRGGVS